MVVPDGLTASFTTWLANGVDDALSAETDGAATIMASIVITTTQAATSRWGHPEKGLASILRDTASSPLLMPPLLVEACFVIIKPISVSAFA